MREFAPLVGACVSRAWLGGLLCALFSSPSVAGAPDDDPQQSINRMVQASQTLNYDGTFVYRNGATMQSMRIIHRFGADGEWP